MTRNTLAAALGALTLAAILAGPVRAQALPEGAVTLYAGNDTGANFLIDDTIVREGARVRFSNLRVFANLIDVPGGPIAMDVSTLVIDCVARTMTVSGMDTFKASGDPVVHFPGEPTEAIEADSSWDFAARVLCDGVEMPPQQTRSGWRDARAIALSMLGR
jgi:hypothetical protein